MTQNYITDLSKMRVEYGQPVRYFLTMESSEIDLNSLIGKKISVEFKGVIHCVACGRVTKKSFGQGFCYPCFMNSPENSECIIHPELCEGHLGGGRDPEWEEKHHNQPHTVYLALTSDVKVGVTRNTQIPGRWIDQGAWKAIRFAETPNRYLAGKIEVDLKSHMTDITNWRKMLTNQMDESRDLVHEKSRVSDLLSGVYHPYLSQDDQVLDITYPVEHYPVKISSLNLDKENRIEGVLQGIRGQYMYFDAGRVINVRKFSGYEITFSIHV